MKTLNSLLQEAIYYNQENKLPEWYNTLSEEEKDLLKDFLPKLIKGTISETK